MKTELIRKRTGSESKAEVKKAFIFSVEKQYEILLVKLIIILV